MMIPQQSATNVVQIATSLAQNPGPNTPAVASFARDHAAQIRFAASICIVLQKLKKKKWV